MDKDDARRLRLMAHAHRARAAQFELAATAVDLTAAFRGVIDALAAGDATDIAAHPDLAYLDVQMNGFYDR